MNGKRVNVESLLTCDNIFRTFLIEERVGESEKAFHDFTTCGRLSYRIKSTRVWETSQENKRASKHGEEFIKPHICSLRFAPLASRAPHFQSSWAVFAGPGVLWKAFSILLRTSGAVYGPFGQPLGRVVA